MAPERYEAEAREAVRLGYTCMKIKTRPWWDVHETIARISEATPAWFAIDADWNDFLLDAPTALPVLSALEKEFPKIKIYEGPIPSDDIDGNRRLRARVAHADRPPLRRGAAGRGARRVLRRLRNRRRHCRYHPGRSLRRGGAHAVFPADGRHRADRQPVPAPGRGAGIGALAGGHRARVVRTQPARRRASRLPAATLRCPTHPGWGWRWTRRRSTASASTRPTWSCRGG